MVDAKLVHLVKKFLSQNRPITSQDVDHIVNCIRTQHREYKRKELTRLKKQVQKVLRHIAKIAEDNSDAQNGDGDHHDDVDGETIMDGERSKKRSVEEMQEDQHEKKARMHDMERESQLGGSSMLNAGLRDRYRKLQQERDEESRAGADTASHQNDSNADGKDTTTSAPNAKPNTTNKQKSATKGSRRRKGQSSPASKKSGLFSGVGPSDEKDDSYAQAVPRPTERYSDLGGMDDILQQIQQLIEYPLVRPEIYKFLGVDPPRGVLLRGPPGCGKTHLANAIAGQLGVPYFRVSAPELVSGMSGESEGRIRNLFQAASDAAPSLIFMDELDAVAPKRGDNSSGRGMEKRMVAQLLTCMDSIHPKYNRNNACVMVVGATNRPDSIDAALRRAGRFDKEILLGVPDEEARLNIIKTMTKDMRLSGDFDYKVLARKTPGYVGADIRSLTKEAAVIAIDRIFKNVLKDQALTALTARLPLPAKALAADNSSATTGTITQTITSTGTNVNINTNISTTTTVNSDASDIGNNNNQDDASTMKIDDGTKSDTADNGKLQEIDDIASIVPLTNEQMEPLSIGMSDFLEAIPHVQPSSKREGFATVPDVSWDDIGALGSIREELVLSVLEPIRNPEKFQALGIPLPAGVMLYGPPGCGKTLLAKAIANESGANFISVKGPELLDKYVGESERSVRLVFERARSSSPCVVFFDELDSLCPRRGSDGGGGGGVSERVVNQLLTEMDGLDSRRSVFVIAATNRPELIDPAMMRPGRLDKLLYVPLPTAHDRVSILNALSKNVKLSDDVDLSKIGSSSRAEGYSGADCAALLREAGLAVIKVGLSQTASPELMQCGGDGPDAFDASGLCITNAHFQYAFDHVMPSVSKKDQARYDRMRDRMARARSRGAATAAEETEEGRTPTLPPSSSSSSSSLLPPPSQPAT